MSQLVSFVRAHIRTRIADERGANAIEYGLIAAVIALVIIVGAIALGGSLDSLFSQSAETLNTAADNAG